MRYFVTLAGKTVEVELTGGELKIDGDVVHAQLGAVGNGRVRHLLLGNESRTVLAEATERKGFWKLHLGGRTIVAEIVDERTRAIREMTGTAADEAPRVVAAPMPGLVVRIGVEPGQKVQAGQGLIVVEAMKMENELKAPADGIVARIEVTPGQTVEKGTVLVVLE